MSGSDFVKIVRFQSVQFSRGAIWHPKCHFVHSQGETKPIKETVMSLRLLNCKDESSFERVPATSIEKCPMFFFIYNVGNYFHFLYDTLPYLLNFRKIREAFPETKLLMNYADSTKFEHYRFVLELLEVFGVDTSKDIVDVKDDVIYDTVYVSDSFTYGNNLDDPPHSAVLEMFKLTAKKVASIKSSNTPKKFYVSRRTHRHSQTDNLGTNYTQRRLLVNEDEVVNLLSSHGYEEVFTETMSTREKIALFNEASHIVGAASGGVANCLFSNPGCNLVVIVSPTFFDVNERMKHCFSFVSPTYFSDTRHVDKGQFKRYCRVQIGEIVGEIEEVYDDSVLVYFTREQVAGWRQDRPYEKSIFMKDQCVLLDAGLNSPWEVNIDMLSKVIK